MQYLTLFLALSLTAVEPPIHRADTLDPSGVITGVIYGRLRLVDLRGNRIIVEQNWHQRRILRVRPGRILDRSDNHITLEAIQDLRAKCTRSDEIAVRISVPFGAQPPDVAIWTVPRERGGWLDSYRSYRSGLRNPPALPPIPDQRRITLDDIERVLERLDRPDA